MPTLSDLPLDYLRAAGDAIETVLDFRAYLSTDGTLIMLAAKFRDDIRELLGLPSLPRVSRATEGTKLDSMEDAELECLFEAVLILNGRFTRHMDDPELPKCLADVLGRIGFQRASRIVAAEAQAS
jgi:hypothetical protein